MKNRPGIDPRAVFWRKRWDSNPRYVAVYLISSQGRYDHFDTLPYAFVCDLPAIPAGLELRYTRIRPPLERDTHYTICFFSGQVEIPVHSKKVQKVQSSKTKKPQFPVITPVKQVARRKTMTFLQECVCFCSCYWTVSAPENQNRFPYMARLLNNNATIPCEVP